MKSITLKIDKGQLSFIPIFADDKEKKEFEKYTGLHLSKDFSDVISKHKIK